MSSDRTPVTTLAVCAIMVLSMAAVAVPVAAAPQPGITAPNDAGTVQPGDNFTVTYTLTNTGDQTAGSARIDLLTPTGINVTSTSGDGNGAVTGDPPVIFYGLSGVIPAGESRQTTVTYTVDPNATSGAAQIDAEAFVNGSSSSATTSTTVTVDAPSKLELSGSPETVNTTPGGRFNVTYEYTNNQSTQGLGGAINLDTPENITAVAVSGDGFGGLGGSQPSVIYGASGPIPGGATLTTTVTYEVNASASTGTEQIVGSALIRGADGTDQTTTTVNIGTSIVSQYDTNGTPGIQRGEVLQAIVDFNTGNLTTSEVLQVIVAFNSGS